jgi:hypothetical protein
MAAPSMAEALAASLPAPQDAPTPAAPTYEAIPASMSKAIDIEAEIPLTCVQLDGLVRYSEDHFASCPVGVNQFTNFSIPGYYKNFETQS